MQRGRETIGRRRFIAGATRAGAATALAAWAASRASGVRRQRSRHARRSRPGPAIERLGALGRPGGNALAVAWKAGPPSLDVQTDPSPATTSFACAVMSGLLRFRLDPDPETSAQHILEPDLAARWETPDVTYWVLHLRPDARFLNATPINGHPVESEDVRASFTRAAQAAQSQNRAVGVTLDGTTIETPDRQTVIFRLPRPYAPLPQLLASVPDGLIFPREAAIGAYDPGKIMFGSGPFALQTYIPFVSDVHGGLVHLARNGGYFEQGFPYLDGVRQAIIPSEEDQVAQFTAGNLDVVRVGQSAMTAATTDNPNAQVVQAISDRNYAIFFQLRAGSPPPFIDIRLREAVSEAIDRDAIGQALYGGQYDLAFAVNLSMGPWALRFDDLNPAEQQRYTFDPGDAALHLRAAGYAALPFRLAYPAGVFGPELDTMAQMIAGMLSAVLGTVTPVPIDYVDDYLGGGNGYRYGTFPADTVVLAPIYPFQNVDRYLSEYYLAAHSPSTADSIPNPELESTIDRARAQVDPDLMRQSYLDAQQALAGRPAAVTGLPVGYSYTLLQPWVQNYSAPPEAYSVGRAWRTVQLVQ